MPGPLEKNMRRLIVHIGVQKTGSTGLQRHLRMNKDLMAGHLVCLTPDAGAPMRNLGRAAVAYSLDLSQDAESTLRDAVRDALDCAPANDLPVILSHENLAGAVPGSGGEAALFPALPRIARIIMDSAPDFSVDFVIYTREMSDWKVSVWSQIVRSDGYTGTLTEFLDLTDDLPEWDDLTDRIKDVTGEDRLTCFLLEDEPNEGHPGQQLLRFSGLSDDLIGSLKPLYGTPNRRLNDASTEFLRRLNSVKINPYARSKVSELVALAQELFAADLPSDGAASKRV